MGASAFAVGRSQAPLCSGRLRLCDAPALLAPLRGGASRPRANARVFMFSGRPRFRQGLRDSMTGALHSSALSLVQKGSLSSSLLDCRPSGLAARLRPLPPGNAPRSDGRGLAHFPEPINWLRVGGRRDRFRGAVYMTPTANCGHRHLCPNYRSHRRRVGERRSAVAQTLERRACRERDQPAAPA